MLNKKICLSLLLAATLSGCASDPVILEEPAITEKGSLFYEAKERTQVACLSTQSLSVKHPMHTIIFDCPQLQTKVTTEQMKDAGWSIESIDIGQHVSTEDGTVEMPLKIIIRKLK